MCRRRRRRNMGACMQPKRVAILAALAVLARWCVGVGVGVGVGMRLTRKVKRCNLRNHAAWSRYRGNTTADPVLERSTPRNTVRSTNSLSLSLSLSLPHETPAGKGHQSRQGSEGGSSGHVAGMFLGKYHDSGCHYLLPHGHARVLKSKSVVRDDSGG